MTQFAADSQIRSQASPTCAVCGASGNSIHQKLEDNLFGAWGSWNQRKCSQSDCGLVWLDPMPLADDLDKAYRNYYTHSAPPENENVGLARRIYRLIKRGYQTNNYGYYADSATLTQGILGSLIFLSPMSRAQADAEVRFLHCKDGGRLLDVGCGSGAWLQFMEARGWQGQGMDFDPNAVAVGTKNGLDVTVGSLEQQEYPSDHFDAITLSHVIEHVPDPVGTLVECARLLKQGGKLVIATPNNASLGHRFFGPDWRGLEPPRHLHIFSPQSLRRTLGLAGFQNVTIRPQVARSVILESFNLWRGAKDGAALTTQSKAGWLVTRVFNAVELCLVPWRPSVSDCMTAIAVK